MASRTPDHDGHRRRLPFHIVDLRGGVVVQRAGQLGNVPRLPIERLDIYGRWFDSVIAQCEGDIAKAMGSAYSKEPPIWTEVEIARIDFDGTAADALRLTDGRLRNWIEQTDPQEALPETAVALWSAGLAAVTVAARETRTPIHGFALGRLWEACFQERHQALLYRKLHGQRIKGSDPEIAKLHLELRSYASKLCVKRGRSRRAAARQILNNRRLVELMVAVAGRPYSESNLVNRILVGIEKPSTRSR